MQYASSEASGSVPSHPAAVTAGGASVQPDRWNQEVMFQAQVPTPGVADVAVMDDEATPRGICGQAAHRCQAGVLLPKAILIGAIHLATK